MRLFAWYKSTAVLFCFWEGLGCMRGFGFFSILIPGSSSRADGSTEPCILGSSSIAMPYTIDILDAENTAAIEVVEVNLYEALVLVET